MKNRCVFGLFIFVVIWFSVACQVYKSPVQIIEEKRLRNAVRIHPVHELAYVRLAQYLESHGRYTETFSVLRVGQQRIPDAIALVRLEGGLFQGFGYYNDSQKFYSAQISKHPDEALLYLDRAQLYWRMEKQQLALADAQKAITLQPDLFEAHYLTGVILSRKTTPNLPDQSEKALDAFISASEINERNPDLWLRISVLWERIDDIHKAKLSMLRAVELSPESKLYLQRLTVLQEKELNQASQQNSLEITEDLRKTLLHMLKLFPDNSWVQAHYGNWFWTQDKFEIAEIHLRRALTLNSNYPWASFRLGVVYLSQEKWESALLSFEEGLIHDPENEWAIQQVGHALEMLGKNEQAIERYEWLMENAPANLLVINRLNRLYWTEFLFEKGENTLLRGLQKFPTETRLIEKLVAYYESHRLFEKAANILRSFVLLEPNNAAALAKIGFYEKNLNHPEKALLWFNKALSVSNDFEWARIQKIGLLLKIANTETAEVELKNFLKQKPDSEWALLELSQLKLKQEQFVEAEKLLKRGLKKHKDSPGLLQTQGRLYKIQQRWQEAEIVFQKLLKLRPYNSLLLTHLGFTQWKLNKISTARQNITQALYENPGSLWAWNLHLLLLPEDQQSRWFSDEHEILLPVLKAIVSQTPEKAWQKITAVRTDPFTRQVLKNLHYLLEGAPEEIILEPQDMTSKKLPPWMHEQWGYFHEMLGNRELAAKHFEVVSKVIPENSWIHARMGWVYERLEKLEQSRKHYRKFLQKHPQAFDVSFRLANVETLLGNEAATIELYEKLIAVRPDNDLVLNNLAWLYLTAQDRQLRNLERAMKLAQKSVDLLATIDNLDTLAEAYFQSGDTKKALDVIRKAASDVDYSPKRHSYLLKQLLRFRKGNPDSKPPALS
ncbi:MAG: tetratricopeptide repeat protein [Proteobacteria bacterium]|jgi:tetratricopeptide (TPR) repeat protein|nr:tetratricopeptide repeat protein [Pseudomonadota bacterium]